MVESGDSVRPPTAAEVAAKEGQNSAGKDKLRSVREGKLRLKFARSEVFLTRRLLHTVL